ncbi:inactive serine protease 54 isoform X4 [Bos javanicus]|uniref:inactive serine protease 54 isoform X4 n=1 Tax=Bos javanicus TaxID=9906 RepID=UPI002AA7EC55|nr:inactive serine protease 54 isoform X4 [Bos javanicus]
MVSAAAVSGDGSDEKGAPAAALRLPRICQLRHPEKQHCGHFRGGFGRRAGVPVGGVAAGFPVHPPDFRQHPQKDAVAIIGIAKMDAKLIAHEEYPINTIIIHEDFDNKTMRNNIALLKTDTAMQFNSLVRPICFLGRKLNRPPVLMNCWVAGWNPTSATGNHMTMSILRKISVKDIDSCPLNIEQKTGCGNHLEMETNAVCLGDPGNPMMCQLKEMSLWVLRGILSQGGEKCPGLFLYIRVEDYSDWITSKTRKTSSPLSSFHHWENPSPLPSYSSRDLVTQRKQAGLSQLVWPRLSFQGQERSTVHSTRSLPDNGTQMSLDFREKGRREPGRSEMAIQPTYYDYYGGEFMASAPSSGQNSSQWARGLPGTLYRMKRLRT